MLGVGDSNSPKPHPPHANPACVAATLVCPSSPVLSSYRFIDFQGGPSSYQKLGEYLRNSSSRDTPRAPRNYRGATTRYRALCCIKRSSLQENDPARHPGGPPYRLNGLTNRTQVAEKRGARTGGGLQGKIRSLCVNHLDAIFCP